MKLTAEITSILTDTQDIALLKTMSSEQLVQDWRNQYQIDITDEMKGHHNIYLYQCNQTKLKFFTPLDIAGSDQLYEQLQKYDWYYMPRKWEHDVAILDLDNCHKILEVGCGKGAFVKRLRDKLNLDAQGIELNSSAAAYATKQGIPVSQIDLYDLSEQQPNYFDVVCSFQVLEHIAEPKKFLNSLVNLVRPGGKLIVAVPNAECFTKHCENNLLDTPPHHMTKWSKDTFKAITSIFPLKVLKFRFEPMAEYHIDWYISIQMSRLPKNRLIRSLAFRFAHRVVKPILKRFSAMRSLIKGHSIYVCFEKTGK